MTSHRFLTDHMKMEEVIYGDQYRMIANFDDQARSADGKELPPYGYILEG